MFSFSTMVIDSIMNSLENGRVIDSVNLLIQYSIAASPSPCGMLVYKLTTSKDTRSAFSSIVSGRRFRKSKSSRMKLGTCSQRGFKTMSMKLLSRCVGDDGPATIGRSLRSDGACTLKYVEFCWSIWLPSQLATYVFLEVHRS